VDHGEPRAVAISSAVDHVLAEEPFVLITEALGCGARFRVLRIALPFEAAVAEIVEDVARVEEERLRRDARARDPRSPEHVADLDDTEFGRDAHQRLPP